LKKRLTTILKFLVPVAIIAFLIYSVASHEPGSADEANTFEVVGNADWNWGALAAGLLLSLVAVSITFFRWYLLVRALELKFRLGDAFRLGFLGFMFNFVGAGSVGGDLFKAVFIAREQPGRRTEAVATVVVDRMVGLYALLIVTTIALWFTRFEQPTTEILIIRRMTYILAAVGGMAVLMVLVPGFTSGTVSEWLASIPRIGPTLERLIQAVRMYRRCQGILLAAGVMSLCVHALFGVSVWCLAVGLFSKASGLQIPNLHSHLIIVPLTMLCAALPISPAGLGTFELALEALYRMLATVSIQPGQGLIVALAFRVVQIGLIIIGVIYYWSGRQEVSELMHEVELEEKKPA
jgi:uncharacterized protein (TIRG00374 family)